MPFWFLVAIVLAIVTVLLVVGWASTRKSTQKSLPGIVPSGVAGLTVLVFLVTVVTIVPTRSIGVVTSFNRPVDTYSNGLHLKAPWEKVRTLDGTIRTDNHTGDNCTDIRIGNESTACVDNSVRWRIRLDAGQRLYQDYREMENIRDSLVTRELKAALNEVLSEYNPLEQLNDDKAAAKPDLSAFSAEVEAALKARVGEDVEIKSVIIPIIRFDKQTQAKINAYQAEVANTRIAEQREKTAKAQARANENLKESVADDPNVLVAQCLETFAEMVKAEQPIPIGFSCWPGASGTSVVIPQPAQQ